MMERPQLVQEEDGLKLVGSGMTLMADFREMLPRIKQSNLERELLVKAARIKSTPQGTRLHVLDATAGFGEDSLLLAAAGFQVELYEYDAVIAALLRDALVRAEKLPQLAETVARMTLHEESSIEAMQRLAALPREELPEVIYLDPMFPERKKSGMIGKKFQLLQRLEQPCDDEAALFDAAKGLKPKKLIVKRPLKGPYLAGEKPDYGYEGKAIRYDCYVRFSQL